LVMEVDPTSFFGLGTESKMLLECGTLAKAKLSRLLLLAEFLLRLSILGSDLTIKAIKRIKNNTAIVVV